MLAAVIHARGLARTFRKRTQEVHAVVGVDLAWGHWYGWYPIE
jgi:ABC-2 type transport system ATP-binding protein